VFASFLGFFKNGPPPPKAALLSDALFFTHSVPISEEGAAAPPDSAPQGVGAQVELALEGLSPFLLTQLYYGYFWTPGSRRALVFAAYRRRFTVEQTAAWAGAEVVLPSFAAFLGGPSKPGQTWILSSAEGLTAVRWGEGGVPGSVLFRPVPSGLDEAGREEVRSGLLRQAAAGAEVVELAAPPEVQPSKGGGGLVFRSGSFESELSGAHVAALDVRDKAALGALRRARVRDALLWRIAAASFVLFGLLILGEIALKAGGLWQDSLQLKANAQAPEVARITTAQNLAHRIDELSTKRLLPLEMVSIVSARKPDSVQFIRAFTNERDSLTVDAQANNPGDISIFRNQVASEPECASVEVRNQRTRNNVASFTLVVTFKPGAVRPAVRPS
jgi:hypothetical protein